MASGDNHVLEFSHARFHNDDAFVGILIRSRFLVGGDVSVTPKPQSLEQHTRHPFSREQVVGVIE